MTRLQSKCMFGSVVAHGLLLALVVIGSAFVNPTPPPDNVRFIKIFPPGAQITDEATSGGGDPNAGPSAAIQAPAPIQNPNPAPQLPIAPVQDPTPVAPAQQPKQTPKAVVETPKPLKPKKPVTKPVKKPVEDPQIKTDNTEKHDKREKQDAKKPKQDPPKVVDRTDKKPFIDTTQIRHASADPDIQRRKEERLRKEAEARRRAEEQRIADQRAEEEYQERLAEYNRAVASANAQAQKAAAEKLNAIANAVGSIHQNLSGSAMVEFPAGPGGAAFINYRDFIFSAYYKAWETPDERSGSQSVRVEIVVARDGRVMSAKIVDKSGNAALDKSVRQALDRVPRLPAFPVTTSDETRTFYINFQLDAKRQFG